MIAGLFGCLWCGGGAFARQSGADEAAAGSLPAQEVPANDPFAATQDQREERLRRELWINDQLTQADRFFQRADFATAIRVLKKIVARYPGSEDAANARELIEAIRENAGELLSVEQGP